MINFTKLILATALIATPLSHALAQMRGSGVAGTGVDFVGGIGPVANNPGVAGTGGAGGGDGASGGGGDGDGSSDGGTGTAGGGTYGDYGAVRGVASLDTFSKPVELSIPVANPDTGGDVLTIQKVEDGKVQTYGGTYESGTVNTNRRGF